VLVWHDLLGLIPGDVPRFVKAYADGATVIREALERFAQEVRDGTFPDASHTYGMPDAERARFENTPAASRRR
jgi:3-methyl-2-oxobutanoate hydroxymethyltransferase